jgi:hypothetical protein
MLRSRARTLVERPFLATALALVVAAGCSFKHGGLQVIPPPPPPPGTSGEGDDGGPPAVVADAGDARIILLADGAAGDGAPATDGPAADVPVGSSDGPRPTPDGPVPDTRPPAPDLPPPPPPEALLLVGDTPPSAADGLVQQRIQGLGFHVQALPVRNFREAMTAADAAAGKQLLVLSDSMPQGPGLPSMVRDLAVGLICLKPTFLDNLGMGDSPFGMAFHDQIRIAAPNHPLAGGQRGVVTITGTTTRLVFGQPIPSATVIASGPDNDESFLVTIFAIDRGANLRGGTAHARRVGWMAQESTINALNANGWALFDAAVRWASAR